MADIDVYYDPLTINANPVTASVEGLDLEGLVSTGVFYGAAASEARAMAGQHVCVVGASNSAGQAAILSRGDSLARSMSEYPITEIEQAPNVTVRLGVELVGAEAGRLGGGGGRHRRPARPPVPRRARGARRARPRRGVDPGQAAAWRPQRPNQTR